MTEQVMGVISVVQIVTGSTVLYRTNGFREYTAAIGNAKHNAMPSDLMDTRREFPGATLEIKQYRVIYKSNGCEYIPYVPEEMAQYISFISVCEINIGGVIFYLEDTGDELDHVFTQDVEKTFHSCKSTFWVKRAFPFATSRIVMYKRAVDGDSVHYTLV